jgi:CPA2 family monovalent cation:H+ antiporter-2
MRKRGRELKEALSKGDSKPPDMVVIGYGPAGREAVDRLLAKGLKVTVIESNPALAATIRSAKRIVGDATSREILVHARIAEARTAVISIPDPGASRTILALIRSLAPGMQVIVRGRYHRYVQVLRSLGAKDVADEELIVGGVLGDAALRLLNASANGTEE